MKVFLRANWINLLAAVPAAVGVAWVYEAIAALGTPNPHVSGDNALEAYAAATDSAEIHIGWVTFFAVIALVIWKWKKAR